GTITVTYSGNDACGNPLSQTHTINVQPAPAPTFTSEPTDITVACDAIPAIPTVSYNNGQVGSCAIGGTVTATRTGSVTSCGGTLTDSWTFTDDCGRNISGSRAITVTPPALPTMTAPANITVACGISTAPSTIPFTNGLTGACLITGTSNNSVMTGTVNACGGTLTETWTATDACGRPLTPVSRTITVQPAPAPVFPAAPDINVACGTTISPSSLSYTNNADGSCLISGTVQSTLSTIPGDEGGEVIETWTYTDACNRTITRSRKIIVAPGNITPTFATIGPLCQGATAPVLPGTSQNGIAGTWSPATINTSTIGSTTYYFTPTAGQCAIPTTLAVEITAPVTPTFNAVPAICSGATLTALPTTSTNGITGIWSPALNNTATTTYTFTPTAGQCATTATLTITVNPILSPTINCGASTTSSVTFNWAAVSGATSYSVSYQVNGGTTVSPGNIGNVLTYQVTGLTGGDQVTITVTPIGGAGTCFAPASATCTATECTPPTANISYNGPYCINISGTQDVDLTGTGTYQGGTFSSTSGLTINATSGAITPSTSTPGTYTVTYTVAGVGGCPGTTATTTVTILPLVTPS
ncbi:MAG TPA: hypothetical protein VK907_13735, partial [Phnomibacter sp.]|nr:hypothetical protein [Phnomibacter sp.]